MFAAQFPGKCSYCRQDFKAGRQVEYDDQGNLFTVDCTEVETLTEESREEARKNMCPTCFIVKPRSGVCSNCE